MSMRPAWLQRENMPLKTSRKDNSKEDNGGETQLLFLGTGY